MGSMYRVSVGSPVIPPKSSWRNKPSDVGVSLGEWTFPNGMIQGMTAILRVMSALVPHDTGDGIISATENQFP